MTGQFPGSRAETSDTLSGAMGLVVFVSVGAFRTASVSACRKRLEQRMAGIGKGFGCRPGASDRPGIGAGVGKPPMNEPAGRR